MARSEGRIKTSIWDDDAFTSLDAGPQRLYMFLLSQRDLSHAGLLPLRIRRWARKVGHGDPAQVAADLAVLVSTRFVLVDEDSEELLIRTFVRNDGVYKQPKVMLRMREDARQIESPALRRAFLAELDRLPLDELPLASTREVVGGVVDTLRQDFATPTPKSVDTQVDTLTDGYAEPTCVGAGAFLLPPSPIPLPPTETTPSPAAPSRPVDPPGFAEFWSHYPRKVGKDDARKAWTKAVRRADVETITAGVVAYAADPNLPETTFVPHPATWLNGGRWEDGPLPPRNGASSALSAKDRTAFSEEWANGTAVAEWEAVVGKPVR